MSCFQLRLKRFCCGVIPCLLRLPYLLAQLGLFGLGLADIRLDLGSLLLDLLPAGSRVFPAGLLAIR
jgi:hypothetical protein